MGNRIIAAVDDIFFASKIRATAEQLDVEVRFERSIESVLSRAHEIKPDLIVVDLQSSRIDSLKLAAEIHADQELRDIPLLGFFSHVLADLQRAAVNAGYSKVIPRSVFSRDLAQILAEKT